MSYIISVVSGKGGVGKTTLSAAIAVELALSNKRILVIDGDVGLRNLDIHLGVSEKVVYDFNDVLTGKCEFAKAVIRCPHSPKLCFLAAPQFLSVDSIANDCFKKLCDVADEIFDYIIIDCSAGIGKMFDMSVKCADLTLIVTAPDHSSIRDAERVCELAHASCDNIRLIINKVNPRLIKSHYARNIDEIIDDIGARLIGVIPESVQFIKSANTGRVVTSEKTPAGLAVKNTVARLSGQDVALYKFW